MRKHELHIQAWILLLFTISFLAGCKPKSGQTADSQSVADSLETLIESTMPEPEEPQPVSCSADDSLALVSFFYATGGEAWLDPWTLDDLVFYWEGITLSEEGRVTGIALPDFNIRGSLPEEMAALTELRVLDLDNNPVTGEILLVDYAYGGVTYYQRQVYNDFEPNFEEDQLNWYTAYVYHPDGLDIYASPEVSDENSIGTFGQGETAYLLEPLNADPHDMFETDGYRGCMRPVDLGYDTAWIFSGYLCKLMVPEEYMHGYFYEVARLLYTRDVERGYEKQGDELITNDEAFSEEHISRFEHGITIVESGGYVGGGTSIIFNTDFWDIQEVYLFADVLRGGTFTEKFGRSFPAEPRKDTIIISEETMEILTVRFDESGEFLQEISISLEDMSYFEDLSIYVSEEEINLNWGGGD